MRNLLPMGILVVVSGIMSVCIFDDNATRTAAIALSLLVFLGLQLGDMQDRINRLR